VSQSGGHIWVYSEPGHGAVFKVYLPQMDEFVLSTHSEKALTTKATAKETILLVEDNEAVRELTKIVLIEAGYNTLVATTGVEALEISKINPDPIHLLVTDVIMPGGISGRQLAESLAPLRPGMKVMIMSGYTDDAIVHHGVLDWGKAFLQKPFTPKILLQKIREVLDSEPE
jgi:CheY-like chemotaxis protein